MNAIRNLTLGLLLLSAVLLTGCAYTLRGKVVRGSVTSVEIVHATDPRVQGPGIESVDVSVRGIPERGEEAILAGRRYTSASGNFSMQIDESGAGWMHEQWRVEARKRGYQVGMAALKLPPKHLHWWVLITLAPGEGLPPKPPEAHESMNEDSYELK